MINFVMCKRIYTKDYNYNTTIYETGYVLGTVTYSQVLVLIIALHCIDAASLIWFMLYWTSQYCIN